MGNAVTISAANMRSGAGIFFNVLRTLPGGTAVTILDKSLGWFRCTAGGTTGFITDTLLRITDPAVADRFNPIRPNFARMVSFTTRFSPSDVNRNHNIELSAHRNSIVVRSGGNFSFNTNTGNSTRTANGWRESIIISGGQFVRGIGGGICQTSSTIFSAVKQLPGIRILERHIHSRPVGYVPVSGEAMVNFGSHDFRFRNEHTFDIFLHVPVNHNAGSVTCEVYRINPVVAPPPPPRPTVIVNGQRLSMNIEPMIFNDRLFIEARSLFEHLGFTVTFDDRTRVARMTRPGEEFILERGADSTEIIVIRGGIRTAVPITIPIRLVSDRMMFPLRFAGELTGHNVSWDDRTRTATLTRQ